VACGALVALGAWLAAGVRAAPAGANDSISNAAADDEVAAAARRVAAAAAAAAAPAPAPATPPGRGAARRGARDGASKQTVISLAAVGDVMFGRYYPDGRYHAFGRKRPFRHVRRLIAGHDIALLNLETPICAQAYRKPYRGLTFRADPAVTKLLSRAGFTVAVTANNHSFDQGGRGVRDTLTHLAAGGLGFTGTGRSAQAAWTPYVYVKRGVKVAVLGVTLLRNYPVTQRHGYWAYVSRRRAHEELPRRIAAMRAKYDFFVLSLHFGVEYYQTIGRYDRTLVDKLVRAGVDVLVGHHPHVLRPVVHRGEAVLLYSLGNFLFDYQMKGSERAAVASLKLVKRGAQRSIRRVRLTPVYRHWRRIPMPAKGVRGRRIRKMIRRITDRYQTGTRFRRVGEALQVLPPLAKDEPPSAENASHPGGSRRSSSK